MAPPPQQGQQSESSMGPFWIVAAIFLGVYVIWANFQPQIVGVYLKIKLFEAIGISYFTDSIRPAIVWIQGISPASYSQITPEQLIDIGAIVGRFLRFPLLGLTILGCFYIYFKSPTLHYRKTYSMQSLVEDQEKDWPQITPVAKLDLIKTHLDEGPWASGLTPAQFVKKYKIGKETPIEVTEPSLAHKQKYYMALMSDQAYRIFSMQLGKTWAGVENLPIYAQALFATFAARAAKDNKSSFALLHQISRSSGGGKLDFSGTKALLNKYKNNIEVQKVCQKHAYVLTVMASLLLLAREDGVLSAADFLWLKPVDRSLWYTLNCVGRQTSFVEVGGVYAHWKAELEFGRGIIVPQVSEAVKALEAALKEILFVPEEG